MFLKLQGKKWMSISLMQYNVLYLNSKFIAFQSVLLKKTRLEAGLAVAFIALFHQVF
jgi:hypothetical protein